MSKNILSRPLKGAGPITTLRELNSYYNYVYCMYLNNEIDEQEYRARNKAIGEVIDEAFRKVADDE
jgi:hypothetical protein|uniref:Uncharacterized protein n=1 Tax=Siphoviridae sp. ctwNf2 TaxID=2827597 RepID=A0A8S5RRM3_9CAUD|nr:MAG TPA: hypothetical protein [Siphoviridae sp. ctwNf2]